MQYVGSKDRLSKELAPIIQSYITADTKGYLEPFVGGANMIDKIHSEIKIGCDSHEELIQLLKYAQENELPETISEEEYQLNFSGAKGGISGEKKSKNEEWLNIFI